MKTNPLQDGVAIGHRSADAHPQPIVATLARFSAEDFPEAVEAGFLTGTFDTYRQQLAGTYLGPDAGTAVQVVERLLGGGTNGTAR